MALSPPTSDFLAQHETCTRPKMSTPTHWVWLYYVQLVVVGCFFSLPLFTPSPSPSPSRRRSSHLAIPPRPSFTFLQATLVNRSLSYGTISLLRLLQSTFSIHSSPPFDSHVPSPSLFTIHSIELPQQYHSISCEISDALYTHTYPNF